MAQPSDSCATGLFSSHVTAGAVGVTRHNVCACDDIYKSVSWDLVCEMSSNTVVSHADLHLHQGWADYVQHCR